MALPTIRTSAPASAARIGQLTFPSATVVRSKLTCLGRICSDCSDCLTRSGRNALFAGLYSQVFLVHHLPTIVFSERRKKVAARTAAFNRGWTTEKSKKPSFPLKRPGRPDKWFGVNAMRERGGAT